VGAGVVLPEGTELAGLPAFDGLGRGLVAGVGGELVLEGPAADAGAVGFKLEAAVEFARGGAVGGRGGLEERSLVSRAVTVSAPYPPPKQPETTWPRLGTRDSPFDRTSTLTNFSPHNFFS